VLRWGPLYLAFHYSVVYFVDIILHQQKKDGMRLNIYRIWLIHIVTLMLKDGMRQNIINLWLAVCSIFLLKHTVYSVIGFQLLERSIITIVPNGHAFASSRTKGQRKRTIDYHFKIKKKQQNCHAKRPGVQWNLHLPHLNDKERMSGLPFQNCRFALLKIQGKKMDHYTKLLLQSHTALNLWIARLVIAWCFLKGAHRMLQCIKT